MKSVIRRISVLMLVISMTVVSSGCSVFADTKAGGTADLSGEMAEANEPDETDAPANETGDISTTGADASAATTGADAESSGSENPAAFLRLQVYRILPGQHWMLRRSRLTMRSWRLVCSTKKVSALRPPMRICWRRHIRRSPATMASCSGSAVTITR